MAAGRGGSWKLAYADYVTAMMAFFLLMWLLSSPKPSDLAGLADYFTKTTSTAKQQVGQSPSQAMSDVDAKGGGLSKNLYGEKDVPKRAPISMKEMAQQQLKQAKEAEDRNNLQRLKQVVEKMIEQSPNAMELKDQVKLDNSVEGLLIQLIDDKKRPMFKPGSAEMNDFAIGILGQITRFIGAVQNKVVVSGHTDSSPFSQNKGAYTNWELSADRATSARREMIKAGAPADKVIRVIGMADTVPLVADTESPVNRRIELLVLTKAREIELLKHQLAAKAQESQNTQQTPQN